MATNAVVAVWIFFSLAILIMVARLILGRLCQRKFDTGDRLTIAAIIFSLARMSFTHVVIIWKTNNFSDEYRETHHFGRLEIYHREMGSKFTLVARALYILLLWTQKCVLLAFYQKLIQGMPWGRPTLILYLAVFAVTFCLCIVFTFVECHPFSKYWRVVPDPGKCTHAVVQLFVVGILNIFTNVMLIALPVPILLQVHLSLSKKLQLAFLFCIGFIIVICTAVRIPWTLYTVNSETSRITWTTGEFLAATFVANAPTLYSFRKRFQRRKNRAVTPNRDEPWIERRQLDDLDRTAKSGTQRLEGHRSGMGSGETGETLVGE